MKGMINSVVVRNMSAIKTTATITAAMIVLVLVSSIEAANADEFPVQGRVFAGVTSVDPSNMNQELRAQNLQEFKSISKFGAEITFPVASYLNVGIGYAKRYMSKDETDSSPSTDYQALINQDAVLLLARVPFIKTDIFRADVFAGVGGSNTTLTIKTASQDGELTKREGNDWFASLYASYGASVAVGYKNVYFIVEGGFESNKVDSFKRNGTINGNIQTVDLSGPYVMVGLMFDGIPAHSR